MHWCPYLNFRELLCLWIFWWGFLLMRWMKHQNNNGMCAYEEEQKWMNCAVCGDVCVPGKDKIKPSDSKRIWVSERENCVWRMGYCRAGGVETSHLQPWQALTFIALSCSLSLSSSHPLPLSHSFLSTPLSALWSKHRLFSEAERKTDHREDSAGSSPVCSNASHWPLAFKD